MPRPRRANVPGMARASSGWRRALFTRHFAIALLAAPVAALPSMPSAQTVTVTAGEHRGFTRVVLQSSRAFVWEMDEQEARLSVSVPGGEMRLDQARAMDRIPRTRVLSLETRGSRLDLIRACPCPVRTFEDRPGLLVLDVLDPDPADPPAPLTDARAGMFPARAGGDRTIRSSGSEAVAAGRAVAHARRQADAEAAAAGTDGPPGQGIGFDATRDLADLALALTRALAQEGQPPGPPAPVRPMPQGSHVEGTGEAPAHVRFRSASDPAVPLSDGTPSHCPQDSSLAFATRDDGQDFTHTSASLHRALVADLDHVDPVAARRLAEHYLSWGLGAEARMTLELLAGPDPDQDLLVGIADALENRQSNSRRALWQHRGCPGIVAVFAAVAGPDGQTDPAPRAEPAVLAMDFLRLTPALRESLGFEVGSLLLARGAIDPARMVLDSLRLASGEGAAAVIRLEAELERIRGEDARADTRLSALDPGDIGNLQLLLEAGLAGQQPVSEPLIQSALVLAETHRTETRGQRLQELAIDHLIRASDIATALAELDRLQRWTGHIPSAASMVSRLRGQAWLAALDLADVMFLDMVLSREDWRDATRDPVLGQRFSARFDDLGLVRLAQALRVGQLAPDDIPPAHAPAHTAVSPEASSAGPDQGLVLVATAPPEASGQAATNRNLDLPGRPPAPPAPQQAAPANQTDGPGSRAQPPAATAAGRQRADRPFSADAAAIVPSGWASALRVAPVQVSAPAGSVADLPVATLASTRPGAAPMPGPQSPGEQIQPVADANRVAAAAPSEPGTQVPVAAQPRATARPAEAGAPRPGDGVIPAETQQAGTRPGTMAGTVTADTTALAPPVTDGTGTAGATVTPALTPPFAPDPAGSTGGPAGAAGTLAAAQGAAGASPESPPDAQTDPQRARQPETAMSLGLEALAATQRLRDSLQGLAAADR